MDNPMWAHCVQILLFHFLAAWSPVAMGATPVHWPHRRNDASLDLLYVLRFHPVLCCVGQQVELLAHLLMGHARVPCAHMKPIPVDQSAMAIQHTGGGKIHHRPALPSMVRENPSHIMHPSALCQPLQLANPTPT